MKKWVILFLIFVSCTPRIVTYTNNESRFDRFNSYVLISLKSKNLNASVDEDQILQRLETAINEQMSLRSYSISRNDPDLIVRYEVVSEQQIQNNSNTMSMAMGFNPMYSYRSVIESILLIEIVTSDQQKLVWQASMDLKDLTKTSKNKDVLQTAVEKLFDTYLYRAGQKEIDPNLKSTK